jgi:hypothetical protein
MEVSGQILAPALLPPEKHPPVPIKWEARWATGPVWALWRGELPLPRIEPILRRDADRAIPAPVMMFV